MKIWHSECSQPLNYFILSCVRTRLNKKFIEIACGWGPVTYDFTLGLWPHCMILEVIWDGLWTLSCGLSQCHGHGSWLVCEVALYITPKLELRIGNNRSWRGGHWIRSLQNSLELSERQRGSRGSTEKKNLVAMEEFKFPYFYNYPPYFT